MRIAIQGCSHGELDSIYASIKKADEQDGAMTELVLLCGDFQAIRNPADLHCLAVPEKYKRMGDFHRYYSGQNTAPYLTIVIGGNHEASNYFWELFMGGWLAPNIYYLGAAGCVSFKGLVIAGISGIYKSGDYHRGRFERMPYSPSDVRSIYHTRKFDVQRLALLPALSINPDIFLSHDWPNTIEAHGDVGALIRRKPYFKDEIHSRTLGSPPLMQLLRNIRPRYWFSAHLHVKFAATYTHTEDGKLGNKQEGGQEQGNHSTEASLWAGAKSQLLARSAAAIELTHGPRETAAETTSEEPPTTRFLALGKCVPNQEFLQILNIEPQSHTLPDVASSGGLEFVPGWLAILNATQAQLSFEHSQRDIVVPPTDALQAQLPKLATAPVASEGSAGGANGNGKIKSISDVQQFVPTANTLLGSLQQPSDGPPPWYTNPQTIALCNHLGIENNINAPPRFPPAPTPSMPRTLPPALMPAGATATASAPIEQSAQGAPRAEGANAPTPADAADEIKRIKDAAAARKRKRAEMAAVATDGAKGSAG
ncbi:hypothetical protein K437DRAFT_256928 [Tilletiaria anomala UBC 951]|uniref:Lariat debranching enzyme C-terminal domain-containing protein n=1 Tax=Tilletiaria anomala (strain ATCC 24038 / CBS 436.72 / UBC 951) TaxID=1037660 RepID=A0A066VSH8_TILAU|nr:uncharacterized protein K437DRAFT_256928 [Tilletiaria anomala UBC 951]KDN44692.1 hypothetical protein K437DRAFT_256928 [Tilletiaria anomala UBC 951]